MLRQYVELGQLAAAGLAAAFFVVAAFGKVHYDLDRIVDGMRWVARWNAAASVAGGAVFGLQAALFFLPETSGESSGFSVADIAVLISGFGGGVLGAAAGGLIAWLLARQSSKAVERRDAESRSDQIRVNGRRLLIKVSLIHSDIVALAAAASGNLSAAAR